VGIINIMRSKTLTLPVLELILFVLIIYAAAH
jgi:hypothetical protein